MKAKWVCLFLMLGAVLALPATSQAVPVDLELALLVDVSGSVDSSEFATQQQGYQNAFNDPALVAAIQSSGGSGNIAATLIFWSGVGEQIQVVPWTLISDSATSSSFAAAVGAAPRTFAGSTAPQAALNFAVPLFTGNGFEGTREVIDVSGDGAQNDPNAVYSLTDTARTNALAAGINQINGLAIEGSEVGLLAFYQNHIQGGAGSFTLSVTGFDTFEAGVLDKLTREVVNDVVPEPVTMATLILGLGCLGRYARRRLA